MNFQQREYLPNAEERVVHLQEIVAGRPIAILAAGPSLYILEERIEELRNIDICYFGMNNYTVQETAILYKIDKHFSTIMYSAREGIADTMDDIVAFLSRDEDNMFISSFWRNTFSLLPKEFDLIQFFIKYDK